MSTPGNRLHDISRMLTNSASAAIGLLFLLPLLAAVALLILCADGRPIFFRQLRVGRQGRSFGIWKFRTMVPDTHGATVTVAGDPRVTRIGAFLRQYKLDELPQLVNVIKGEMNLIGPRPEVPEHVDRNAPVWRVILSVPPGITDPAALVYRDEEYLLSHSDTPTQFYRESILPSKLLISLKYLDSRSFWTDIVLLLLTIRCSLWPRALDPDTLHKLLHGEARFQ